MRKLISLWWGRVAFYLTLYLAVTAFAFLAFEPSETLLFLISFILVPALAEIYKLIVSYFEWKPGKLHITIVLSVVAVVLAYLFDEDPFAALPPIGDNPLLWFASLIQGLGNLIGAAVLLYNILFDKFMDAIGERFALFAYRKLP